MSAYLTHNLFVFLFWLSGGAIIYTFVGYAAVIRFMARLAGRVIGKDAQREPHSVSVIVVVHNEEARIERRITNLIESDFPTEKLEIIVVSDGSTDATASKITAFANPAVRLIERPVRAGKAACLNVGVASAHGEIVVFADARQRFSKGTIRELVANFSDPSIGAATGALEIEAASSGAGAGIDIYWRLEKVLRWSESQFDSCIGCTGAVYAIRAGLFQPIPADTILDDVVIPMQIALRGYRVVFDADAPASDPQSLEPATEKIRKERTLAGNFQMLVRYPNWLLPWRNRLWWQVISHKYMRLVSPLFVLLLFIANAALLSTPFYLIVFVMQCIFYTLAVLGSLFLRIRIRLFSIPSGFLFLNLMVLRGFWYFLVNGGNTGWRVRQSP